MKDWAEIRRLHAAEGMAIKAIVRKTGVSGNAVRRALASVSPPTYQRPAKGSVLDAVEQQIRELRPYHLPPDPATRTEVRPSGAVRQTVAVNWRARPRWGNPPRPDRQS